MRFPKEDIECQKVVPFQVGDIERALKFVQEFNVCIQAGGNVGVWPQYLAGKFEEVHTFEPDQENFDCLTENVTAKNVKAFNVGLGDRVTTGKIVGDKKNCGAYQIEDGDEVQIIKIDDLDLNPDFICLDIEGMELLALLGSEKTIIRNYPVIMIEDKGLSEKYGIKKGECGEFLNGLGYELVDEVHRDLIYCVL